MAVGADYSAPVQELAGLGVLTGCEGSAGFDDSRFCPGEPMDRKTMAVWVVRVLDGEDPPPGRSRFPDVNRLSAFWWPFVERMAELGVTEGCGDGANFCPDDPVTRAQMAVFLWRAFDLPDGPDPGFSDVPGGAWYYDGVAALAASGITRGCGSGTTFCPGDDTTRAQMATFLSRARQRTEAAADDTSATPQASTSSGGGGGGGGGGQRTVTTTTTVTTATVTTTTVTTTATVTTTTVTTTTVTPVAVAVAVRFGAASHTATEGGAAATVQVVLSADPQRTVDVPLTVTRSGGATPGDYRVSATGVTFHAGQTTASFTVTAIDDSDDDDGESVTIRFGTLPPGVTAASPSTARVALADNDDPRVAVRFGAASYIATEGGAAATVQVVLSADPERTVDVPLTVTRSGGATAGDYTVSATGVTFHAGQTTASFAVTARDDSDDGDDGDDGESVTIRFGTLPPGVTAASPSTARVALADNDDPLGRVTMTLPAGCVLRDLGAGNEMPYSSYYNGCDALYTERNAHYYRLVLRQTGTVALDAQATTASHLLIRSAGGKILAHDGESDYPQGYSPSLTRTLAAGTYVIEVAAHWSHFRDHGRGHTLRYSGPTIARPARYKLAELAITDVNLEHFTPGTTEYRRNVAGDVRSVTVTPTATLDDAEVTVMPPDADPSTDGYQVDIDADDVTEITVTVNSPMIVIKTEHRVELRQLPGTTAPLSDDAGLSSLSFDKLDIGDFSSDKTDYKYSLGYYERLRGTTATMTLTAVDGATWTANRSDENGDVAGHQLSIDGTDTILVTVTSQDNANTREYRVAPEAPMTRDASRDICSSCDVSEPSGLWSDGESMMTISRTTNTLHIFDMETRKQQSTFALARPSYQGSYTSASRGLWSNGEILWVLYREIDYWKPHENNLLYAYSLETRARLPDEDILFPDEQGSPVALWIDGQRMYMPTFWDILYIYTFPGASEITRIGYDTDFHETPSGSTRAVWSDGTTLWMALRDGSVRAHDADSGRRIPGLDFRTGPQEPRGLWSDGRTMWVIDVSRGYPQAYSMPENARLWKLSVSDGDIGYFHNGKFDYDVEVPAGTTSTTITAEAAFDGGSSSIVFGGTDSDGHQVALTPGEDAVVTITVTAPNGTDTEVYTVTITHAS